jgi:hypothetical protein
MTDPVLGEILGPDLLVLSPSAPVGWHRLETEFGADHDPA